MTVENVPNPSPPGRLPAWPTAWPPALIAAVVAVALLASSTALTQSDGDLFAHIALGRRILNSGIPASVTPAWGSAVLLAGIERVGGLSLIAVCVALLAACTHALLMAVLVQRRIAVRIALLAAMLGFVFAASHWLARPHAITLASSALLVTLLDRRDRRAWLAIPPLFALWANLHGGWSFGLILVACYALARRTWPSLALLLMSGLATVITPYGLRLHAAVLRTLRDPTIARVINEYQPPSFENPLDLLFLATLAIASVALVRAMSRGTLRGSARDTARPPIGALLVILVSAAAALRAGRNISLFAVTGWPLLVAYLAPHAATTLGTPSPATAWSAPAHSRTLRTTVTAAVLLACVALVALGLDTPVSPIRFPVGAVQALQRANRADALLTTWAWSGYVPYAWPNHRAVFNPLEFTPVEVHALGTMLLAQPGWRRALDSLGIRLAMLPQSSPLADSLRAEPEWPVCYRDRTAVVFQRQSAPPQAP